MKMTETMEDLFLEQVEDLYDAEKRLVKALPKMAEASTSVTLRQAFESHLMETEGHVSRLENIFRTLGQDPKGTHSAMQWKGLISEGEDVVSDIDQSPLRDAGLIAAANLVEHYEIAAYGSARTFADIPRSLRKRGSAARADPSRGEEGRSEAHPIG